MSTLPKDPFMLLSYINTLLRDAYSDLAELCADKGADENEVTQTLLSIGYSYDPDANRFS